MLMMTRRLSTVLGCFLGKTSTALTDVLFRYENLRDEHAKLAAIHQDCGRKSKDELKKLQGVQRELEELKVTHANCASEGSEELKKLRDEHAGCLAK